MSRGLKYEDLNVSEQLMYKELVSGIHHTRKEGEDGRDPLPDKAKNIPNPPWPTQTPRPWGQRLFVASVECIVDYGRRWVDRYRRRPRETTSCADLEQFIRTQALQRGFDTFDRASFPHFPDGLDPFHTGSTVDRDTVAHAYPDALHRIIVTFREASPAQRLEMLVAYAGTLPELPKALQHARDTMEQVDECQTPVFLLAQLHEGQVHYYLDVPRDAPTMRGFAGLLHAGLHGATPAAIAATPNDLCQQLGLHKALAPMRLRGLAALLSRMKRNARDLASAG
jgi:cysteine desulfuration protein SufE